MIEKRFELSSQEFEKIRKLIYESIGVNLTEAKKALTISRLSRRVKELEMGSFGDYLKYVEKNSRELDIMFNLITTNVTKFFRENHHFDYLMQEYLPRLEEQAAAGIRPRKLRLWSAACSTGEEPYTLAMILHSYFAKKSWGVKILASDVNSEALEKAQRGIYKQNEIEGIPYRYLKENFKMGSGENEGLFKVKENIQKLITFRRINLTAARDFPIQEPLDIIFCRNVFIYFDKETQERLLGKYFPILRPGGILFLGHSESIGGEQAKLNRWRLVRHTIYERLPEGRDLLEKTV